MGAWKKTLAAAKFARNAHAGQKRLHGAPYFTHPKGVARILHNKGFDLDVVAAGYLHDVVEDTPATRAELETVFGCRIARLVDAVTKRPGEGHEEFYRRAARAGDDAIALKIADREHNNSELHLLDASFVTLRRKAEEKTVLMLEVFGKKS
jgi:guanosine-3',5'-bis(diphosphate) 3'-pyrophosphohydrolase